MWWEKYRESVNKASNGLMKWVGIPWGPHEKYRESIISEVSSNGLVKWVGIPGDPHEKYAQTAWETSCHPVVIKTTVP